MKTHAKGGGKRTSGPICFASLSFRQTDFSLLYIEICPRIDYNDRKESGCVRAGRSGMRIRVGG